MGVEAVKDDQLDAARSIWAVHSRPGGRWEPVAEAPILLEGWSAP